MTRDTVPTRIIHESRTLTAAQIQGLVDVTAELEWFANISNAKIHRAYHEHITDFTTFVGIQRPEEFRRIT